jgi:ribonuclease HIII
MRALRRKMQKEISIRKLKKYGFEEAKVKSKLETARYIGPSTVVLFKTGKLLVQGRKEKVEETKKLLRYLGIEEEQRSVTGIVVGSDETLKGDTFGGIVVCGFKADDETRAFLKQLGVKDSKKLLRPEIVRLATELIEKFPDNYHVESLMPKEYNKVNLVMDVTEILNKLHERCFKRLSRTGLHIVDLYPGCTVGNIRETGAESKYLEVAAASIIARYEGLKQIRELEQKAGFFIPMGSTHIESALLEIKKKSLNPSDYVKMKFKNVEKFFS